MLALSNGNPNQIANVEKNVLTKYVSTQLQQSILRTDKLFDSELFIKNAVKYRSRNAQL